MPWSRRRRIPPSLPPTRPLRYTSVDGDVFTANADPFKGWVGADGNQRCNHQRPGQNVNIQCSRIKGHDGAHCCDAHNPKLAWRADGRPAEIPTKPYRVTDSRRVTLQSVTGTGADLVFRAAGLRVVMLTAEEAAQERWVQQVEERSQQPAKPGTYGAIERSTEAPWKSTYGGTPRYTDDEMKQRAIEEYLKLKERFELEKRLGEHSYAEKLAAERDARLKELSKYDLPMPHYAPPELPRTYKKKEDKPWY